jgi:OmcA/MtrC family decaheme c-type cytochrome
MINVHIRWYQLVAILLTGFFIAACDGDDGAAGATGPAGPAGATGATGDTGPAGTGIEPLDQAKAESCATCHGEVGEHEHQSVYDQYVDASKLALTINNVTSVADGAGTFTVTVDFSITDNGMPLVEDPGLASMDQKRFYAVQYDSVTGEYLNSTSLHEITSGSFTNVVAGAGAGDYVLTRTTRPYAVETPLAPFDGAQVYGYIARGALLEHAGDEGAELPAGSHVHLYDDVSNAAMAFGTADAANPSAYASLANVSGCQTCHGTPYMKHGYRNPIVADLPDFASCKSCHYDDRTGGHEDWQYMVDDPVNWATAGLPEATVEAKYAYKAKLMNDVHMAHAMEFPYPQSMANCATCHAGKMAGPTGVLANTNFQGETCKSCHPVEGLEAWPEDAGTVLEGAYAQEHRAPPMEYIWTEHGVESFHDITADCTVCHGAGVAPPFDELHTGYDEHISDDAGNRYADLFVASINDISMAGDVLTISYTADESGIANAVAGTLDVHVYVSFYGWDTKHFIVPSHQRDGTTNCSGGTRGCRYEFSPGDVSPLFPSYDDAAAPNFVLTVDMAAWTGGQPGMIPDLIMDGTIKKAEVTLAPRLDVNAHDGVTEAALNAVTQTFDLVAEALVADYFKGGDAIVDANKCNVCHDQLAVTFHTGRGRGGDIVACKNCHAPVFPGSHVEMASRSIENYVHAIHSFQAFDTDEVFHDDAPPGDPGHVPAFDPVLSKRYDQHIQHIFPNFTARNCEACHLPGTYNVPDQSKSLPGVLSASDDVLTWYEMVSTGGNIPSTIAVEVADGRNIGTVTETVTGPASRACGGCHRAHAIKADNAGTLASFNEHTKAGGTLVENDSSDVMLFLVIEKIMSMFE